MDNNYLTFMNNMIAIKEQLEKNNSDSYKKILDAVKDFIEAVDSINKLNPKEAKEILESSKELVIDKYNYYQNLEKNV